jgi:membrane-associated phospholipid phosphatase
LENWGWIKIALLISLNCLDQRAIADSGPRLSDGFLKNVRGSFSGTNILFHASGFLSTALLVKTGADARTYDQFRHSPNGGAWPGAVIGSGLAALIAGGWLYSSGSSSNDSESIGAAWAIAQASAITLGYVALLKVTTGRAHPTNSWHLSPQEQSEEFQFGFLRNGVTAYGWPSGHVSHTVAVTSALAHYYPDKPWLAWFGVGLSSYMLYAVTAHDSGQMHWLSDGVAGALVGYAIGSTVGKHFRQVINGTAEEAHSTTWIPMLSADSIGLIAQFHF